VKRATRALAACSCLALLAALSLQARASSARDAQRVQVFMVGRGPALAASEGLDARHSHRSRIAFPQDPELNLRVRLPGGIGQAPAADEAGNLIIVHSEPRLSSLDDKGRTQWTERLPSEASSAPVLLSDGAILIVTRDAEALLFSRAGKRVQRAALPFSDPRRRTLAVPTESGGALVVSGSELVELDSGAQILRQARLRGNTGALLVSGSDSIAVSETGMVERAHATGDFEFVGSFAGSVGDGAAVQAGKVFAIVDTHKWLALDLATGEVGILATDPASTLSGPAALFASGGAALIVDNGFVSKRARDGAETLRVAIGAAGASFASLARGSRGARLISDTNEAVFAVQPGNDALFVAADGSVRRFEGTSCLDPLRPTPTPHAVVFSCRTGQLFAVGDKRR
jgi:hypothetical protein